MELNEIRPFLLPSMDKLASLRMSQKEERLPGVNNTYHGANSINSNSNSAF